MNNEIPKFETEEQEAEYWDTHSPLDLVAEPKAQKVMVRGAKGRPMVIPKFQTPEEERQYWEARGPLAEGRKGRISRPVAGQKRTSFMQVRLTGEELSRLRDKAAQQGLGPSTYARLVIARALETGGQHHPSGLTQDNLCNLSKAVILMLITLEELLGTLEGLEDVKAGTQIRKIEEGVK